MVVLFVATVPTGSDVTLNHENGESRWISLADAAENLEFHGQRIAADEVCRRLIGSAPSNWMRITAYSSSTYAVDE